MGAVTVGEFVLSSAMVGEDVVGEDVVGEDVFREDVVGIVVVDIEVGRTLGVPVGLLVGAGEGAIVGQNVGTGDGLFVVTGVAVGASTQQSGANSACEVTQDSSASVLEFMFAVYSSSKQVSASVEFEGRAMLNPGTGRRSSPQIRHVVKIIGSGHPQYTPYVTCVETHVAGSGSPTRTDSARAWQVAPSIRKSTFGGSDPSIHNVHSCARVDWKQRKEHSTSDSQHDVACLVGLGLPILIPESCVGDKRSSADGPSLMLLRFVMVSLLVRQLQSDFLSHSFSSS